MNIICNNQIVMSGVSEFDLAKTFGCGQCFRWNAAETVSGAGSDGVYTGVAFGKLLTIRQSGDDICFNCDTKDFESLWKTYFDLERDYSKIREQLSISEFMNQAADFGKGIRILRQDPWEALCSFIISQNNNITRIKKIIETLCSLYGMPLPVNTGDDDCADTFLPNRLYTFPAPETLASLTEADLAPLRCGYRARYIISAARSVSEGSVVPDALAALPVDEAREKLKSIKGVGNKVADCVLLFGFHKTEAFPVDVWIKKALSNHFKPDFNPAVFSPYAGIAQQYIFHYTRNRAL